MSARHPIIAVTGSSGAGTSTISRTFGHIFRREGIRAARVEGEYEILLTNQWILQPKLEANLYSKDDVENGIGQGLSELEFGLRLRYEFNPQFAPYVGYAW